MGRSLTLYRGALAWLGVRPAPLALGFELTHLCNLACTYCDRHDPLPNEMSLTEIVRALDEFVELGTRHVSLDGGEPLAHKHVGEVVDFLRERKVRVYMNTNGVLVPKKASVVGKLARVKISLDGPEERHDRMRGRGSFAKALAGAESALSLGVEVELTCVVGPHNADAIDELIDLAERLRLRVVFQPLRPSLMHGGEGPGAALGLSPGALRAAFARIEERKRTSAAVANRWSSLRHFRRFPDDVALPCAAGHINVTLDPEGNLYHCGQVDRRREATNVVRLGARRAFAELTRGGCSQCWCARVVEENYAWGLRVDRMLRPLRAPERATSDAAPKRRLPMMAE